MQPRTGDDPPQARSIYKSGRPYYTVPSARDPAGEAPVT
jgi:hypothetical protein